MNSFKTFEKSLFVTFLVIVFQLAGCASIESKSPADRKQAFEKITDQKEFDEISLHGKYSDMRAAAVDKVTNQQVLERVAQTDFTDDVRERAVAKLTNQKVLSSIAINDTDSDIRVSAIKKIETPNLLANIALTDKVSDVRQAAKNRLINYSPTDDVWTGDKLVMYFLQDPKLIEKMARTAPTTELKLMALNKISDLSLRSSITIDEKDPATRLAMVSESKDEQLLEKVAFDDQSDQVRKAATQKITDLHVLNKIASKEGETDDIRVMAVNKITDQELLAKIAKDDRSKPVSEAAISRLEDKSLVKSIRMQHAKSAGTIDAYESFIKQYSRSKEAAALRKELRMMKSTRLGELVLQMTPQQAMSFSADPFVTGFGTKSHPAPMKFEGVSMQRPSSYDRNLQEFKKLINEGANPMAVRISGYKPKSQNKQVSGGILLISMGGRSEKVVPASKGGITLYKYCKENKITEVANILKKHSFY